MPLCGEVVGERGMGGGAEGGESGNAVQCKAMSLGYYCTIRVFIAMDECVCSYSMPQWRILEEEGRGDGAMTVSACPVEVARHGRLWVSFIKRSCFFLPSLSLDPGIATAN